MDVKDINEGIAMVLLKYRSGFFNLPLLVLVTDYV